MWDECSHWQHQQTGNGRTEKQTGQTVHADEEQTTQVYASTRKASLSATYQAIEHQATA